MWCLLLATWPTLHPDSVSNSVLVVDGQRAGLVVRCQVDSLIEVLPAIDADADGAVTAEEIEASADAILDYVGRHYRLSIGTDRAFAGGRELEPEPVSATHLVWDEAPGRFKHWVDVELLFQAGEPIRDVAIESSLFLSTSPGHRDVLTIEWPGREPEYRSLDAFTPRARSDPEGRGAFAAFAELGGQQLRTRWDVLVFAVALAIVALRRRPAAGVLVWTVALVAGLGAGARFAGSLERYADVLDAAAALSIAYVATDHLLLPPRERWRWLEPALFGAVIGLGLGAVLADPLDGERAPLFAWLGFTAVLAGSALAVGLLALGGLALRPRASDRDDPYLAARPVRRAGAVVLAAAGFALFFLRV